MSDVSRRNFLRTAAGAIAGVVGAGIASAANAARPLTNEEIIRAWKDEEFRNSLTPEQLAQLPQHPAGQVEIAEQSTDPRILRPSRRANTRNFKCCRI